MGVTLSDLPFHPVTNVQALGFMKSGRPIWPVIGAAEDGPDAGGQQQGQQPPAPPVNPDKGFPENTPLAQMSTEQQLAYYKHQNRQADNKLAGFNGFTPADVDAMWKRLEELEGEKLSANDKALKDVQKSARDAAEAEWRPKLQRAELRSIAAEVLKGDQLEAWLAGMNPAAFANDKGEIDLDKVMGHLTAAFGVVGGQDHQQPRNGQQPPAWGQQSGGTNPPARPGEAGRTALEKRHGVKIQ